MRLYLDTSVLGALTDHEDPRRLALTRQLLRSVAEGIHDGVISNIVQEELEGEIQDIEFELVVEDEECRTLFSEYLVMRIVPARSRNDLRHIAAATVAGVDALVSWNFRHLVNLKTRRAVHAVNVRSGHPLLEIVSPEEV